MNDLLAEARNGLAGWRLTNGLERPLADCPVRSVLDKLGDKWSMLILLELSGSERRFSEIRRAIPDISQKMLTQSLKLLQRDGLVKRHVYPTVPPAVGYDLTPLGESLLVPFAALLDWANSNQSGVVAARTEFDRQAGA